VGHELLYDVDFESSLHTVGLSVGTDSGAAPRSGPSRVVFGDPMVVAAHGALADQPLLFVGNPSSTRPAARYDQINAFEQYLTENGIRVLKFFLDISWGEQLVQLRERLEDPEKNWKFDKGDLAERERWDEYTHAYEDVLARCSTEWAPWHVVPSDDRRERNLQLLALLDTIG